MKENEKTQRESNFELLRIILILMIITLHYCNGSMGGLLNNLTEGSIQYYMTHFIESACINNRILYGRKK